MNIELEEVSYSPCFALLAIPKPLNFDAAVVKDSLSNGSNIRQANQAA